MSLIAADLGVVTAQEVIERLARARADPQDSRWRGVKAMLGLEIKAILDHMPRRRTWWSGRRKSSCWWASTAPGRPHQRQAGGMVPPQGKTVLLCAADTFRAAAIEQLEIWGQRTGVEIIKTKQGGDPSAVLFDALHCCEIARDGCAAGRYCRPPAHQERPDEGAGQDAAHDAALIPGCAA